MEHAAMPAAALAALWRDAALPDEYLGDIELTGAEPVLPSSFAVATAAQVSLAAAALAACAVGGARGQPRQRVVVDMRHAALECRGWFAVGGRVPDPWDKISGLYACRDGYLRIHANFAHHRDGALRLLGLPPGPDTERSAVAAALRDRRAFEFEAAAAAAGLVVAAARDFASWDAHAQAAAVRAAPLVAIERIGDAPPRRRMALDAAARPLQGLRVLDLTRILAGPVAGRTLAAYGAEVMLVNAPALPNVEAIVDTSRGKLSTHVDLGTADGAAALARLVAGAHVFVQGYRPGALAARGFAPADTARLRPGIVHASLSAYGADGPWADRRGFDSLVQTASGFNLAEAAACGRAEPRPLPLQILDYASGYLLAFGVLAALRRQSCEGGSWQVRVSLARTGHWLRSLGRVADGPAATTPNHEAYLETYPGGYGDVVAVRHAARFSRTPPQWTRPAMPPGSHAPAWPA